jgi:hypothetical protein
VPCLGEAASCALSKTIRHPTVIRAHATVRPRQDATVTWSMTCVKGSTTGASSGAFTRRPRCRSGLTCRSLTRPASCAVAATVTISGTGKLHAWLTAQN